MAQQFMDILDKKSILEQELETLEEQIYNLETHYLEETQNTGNIIKGWEGYFALKSNKQQSQAPKKTKISPNDRIFSLSSTTSKKAQYQVEENSLNNINNSNGLSQQMKQKRNKKHKKAESKRGLTDSPSRNYEDDISSYQQDMDASEQQEEESADELKTASPLKKRIVKKVSINNKKITKTKKGNIN